MHGLDATSNSRRVSHGDTRQSKRRLKNSIINHLPGIFNVLFQMMAIMDTATAVFFLNSNLVTFTNCLFF